MPNEKKPIEDYEVPALMVAAMTAVADFDWALSEIMGWPIERARAAIGEAVRRDMIRFTRPDMIAVEATARSKDKPS
jgi:hypothetical protein